MTEFLIGADPELFVRKNGKLVSAYGLIPGTKDKPFKVKGGAVQVDGMALEFNIDPASTFKQFNDNIESVLGELKTMVGNDYEFDFSPVAEFGQEYIDAQPAAAKELGCDPDYNAYNGAINPKPAGDLGIRTASGHIHIGWTKDQDVADLDHIEACQMVVKQLDATVGMVARVWDTDNRRVQMYGDYGAYRPKPYGVEYRTPSNVWVGDIRARQMVFDLGLTAVTKLLSGTQLYNDYNVRGMKGYGLSDMYSEAEYFLYRKGVLSSKHRTDLRAIYEEQRVKSLSTTKKPTKKITRTADIMNELVDAAVPPPRNDIREADAWADMARRVAIGQPRPVVVRGQWGVQVPLANGMVPDAVHVLDIEIDEEFL